MSATDTVPIPKDSFLQLHTFVPEIVSFYICDTRDDKFMGLGDRKISQGFNFSSLLFKIRYTKLLILYSLRNLNDIIIMEFFK